VDHGFRTVHRSLICGVLCSATVASAQPVDQAPPADQASGIEVAAPERTHRVSNTLLALPRLIAHVILRGPRYAAAGVDSYLERKSPDVGGRTVATQTGFRFGAELVGENELGLSLAVRIGYKVSEHAAVDLYGGLMGVRGQSGGARVILGDYTALHLQPSISADAGNDLERLYGIGAATSRDDHYEAEEASVTPAIASQLGPFQIRASARFDRVDNDPIAALDPMPAGAGEIERATTEELAITYDGRRRTHPWVNEATYSTGFYVRAAASYVHGDASRSGAFSTGRGVVEARRLFDLFRGDRVLTIGVRGEALTDDSVPFDRMPTLGGRDRMRAFSRDELRGRRLGYATLEYEWALGLDSRGYLFTEAGGVADSVHYDGGIGLRLLTGGSTSLRMQVAASANGDVGFYLQLGDL